MNLGAPNLRDESGSDKFQGMNPEFIGAITGGHTGATWAGGGLFLQVHYTMLTKIEELRGHRIKIMEPQQHWIQDCGAKKLQQVRSFHIIILHISES